MESESQVFHLELVREVEWAFESTSLEFREVLAGIST